MGLARGKAKKLILRKWKREFGPFVDIKTSAVGIKFRLNLDDNVTDGRILTSFNRYDRSEIEILKSICENGTFIDIGANIGLYSLIMAAEGNDVLSIEPNPKTLSRLKYNVSLNDFGSRISILPIGIGDEGELPLVSSGDLGDANIRPDISGNAESITVTVRPLIDVLVENKIERIDGIKIDIEGMEDRALLPFFKRAPPSLWPRCVVIEHCNREYWKDDIIQHMLQEGYAKILECRGNTVLRKQ